MRFFFLLANYLSNYTCFVVCLRDCSFFSASNPGRTEPHLQDDFPFALSFALIALRRLVDDHERGDINDSLLTVQLRCAFVYFSISSLMLEIFFCQLIFV